MGAPREFGGVAPKRVVDPLLGRFLGLGLDDEVDRGLADVCWGEMGLLKAAKAGRALFDVLGGDGRHLLGADVGEAAEAIDASPPQRQARLPRRLEAEAA